MTLNGEMTAKFNICKFPKISWNISESLEVITYATFIRIRCIPGSRAMNKFIIFFWT